ncbi:HAD-IA family hydrolase [Pseudonocardia asaccharolytica]|uniref:Phosphatase n=1 Tax=Pseudonocardia asaccharolytica DSM 44247 = NBRC 16224 TaxID=1123024 RepID=A0A511D5M3_9PSEU|nr:HAD-IA family hydrolase [Pseudonocardia asaccharolytica]GEL19753.1 phosphatase [Pseudonocardia asaccharolytica DSM 44247 = NBRC 16224]
MSGIGDHGPSLARPALRQPRLQAVIFDVDGTLADTERDGHRPAFNEAFLRHGLDVAWDAEEYGRLLQITGGRRRVATYLGERGYGPEAEDLAVRVHQTKTALFRERVVTGGFTTRPGVPELVADLRRAGIRIAVATTGRRAWAEPLVTQLLGPDVVEVLVTGEMVPRLKPDPAAYRLVLQELGLRADEALAVEDSAIGLRSVTAAGLATIVVTNDYTAGQDFAGAAAVRAGFDGPEPLSAQRCRAVHDSWWTRREEGMGPAPT